MKILVVNAGSSSLKYQLIDYETKQILAKGNCERVGDEDSFHHYGIDNDYKDMIPMPDHAAAVQAVLDALIHGPAACIAHLDDIAAVGHRIVSGGKFFFESVLVDEEVIAKIEKCSELAPLHNPGAVMGIRGCMQHMPNKPHITVFDTSYFTSIPDYAAIYPLPMKYYTDYQIKKYGAHGTSHRYVAMRAAEFLGKPLKDLSIITCHVGNGGSVTATKNGKALDTSMGLTPLDGLMMGTRCGTIDPAIVPYIMRKENLTPDEIDHVMNFESGLLGVSGVSNDMRDVIAAAEQGNKNAQLAFDMYAYYIRKYIGEYHLLLGGADAVVFTAGIGENNPAIRAKVFEGTEPLGMTLDQERNQERGGERRISADDSKVELLVIPTNEELMIATDVYNIVSAM